MQKIILLIITLILVSGCTQVVTAPIKITGAVVSSTIDVVGATAHAIAGSDDEDEEESTDD
jgi:uncharacterized protein YceK